MSKIMQAKIRRVITGILALSSSILDINTPVILASNIPIDNSIEDQSMELINDKIQVPSECKLPEEEITTDNLQQLDEKALINGSSENEIQEPTETTEQQQEEIGTEVEEAEEAEEVGEQEETKEVEEAEVQLVETPIENNIEELHTGETIAIEGLVSENTGYIPPEIIRDVVLELDTDSVWESALHDVCYANNVNPEEIEKFKIVCKNGRVLQKEELLKLCQFYSLKILDLSEATIENNTYDRDIFLATENITELSLPDTVDSFTPGVVGIRSIKYNGTLHNFNIVSTGHIIIEFDNPIKLDINQSTNTCSCSDIGNDITLFTTDGAPSVDVNLSIYGTLDCMYDQEVLDQTNLNTVTNRFIYSGDVTKLDRNFGSTGILNLPTNLEELYIPIKCKIESLPTSIRVIGADVFRYSPNTFNIDSRTTYTNLEKVYTSAFANSQITGYIESQGEGAVRIVQDYDSKALRYDSKIDYNFAKSVIIDLTNDGVTPMQEQITKAIQESNYNKDDVFGLNVLGDNSHLTIDDYKLLGTYTFLDLEDSGITQIPAGAFKNNTTLIELNLPSNLTTIANDTFNSMTAINIIKGDLSKVESIGENAIYNCDRLKSFPVETLSAVKIIGKNAFYNCSSLQGDMDISSCTKVEDYGLFSCRNLSSIKLPALQEVGDHALSYCSNAEIAIPFATMVSIGERSFYECHQATGFLSDYKGKYKDLAFYGTKVDFSPNWLAEKLTVEYTDEDIDLSSAITRSNVLNEKYTAIKIITKGSKEITKKDFEALQTYATIDLSQAKLSGNMIPYKAFSGNTILESITYRENITSIGSKAFFGCKNLQSIPTINATEEVIVGEYAFYGCENLTTLNIQSKVYLCDQAFAMCTALSGEIDANLFSYLGNYVFLNTNIKLLNFSQIEDNVLYLDYNSNDYNDFYTCYRRRISNLSKGEVFDTIHIRTVGDTVLTAKDFQEFDNIEGFETVDFSEAKVENNTLTLSMLAYLNCTNCTKLIYPDSITTFDLCGANTDAIAYYNFSNYTDKPRTKLREIVLPSQLKKVPDCFGYTVYSDDKVTVNVPDTVTEIGDYAFTYNNCKGGLYPVIPTELDRIGKYAFRNNPNVQAKGDSINVKFMDIGAFRESAINFNINITEGIGNTIFYSCLGNGHNVHLGEQIIEIKDYFMGMSKDINLTFDGDITYIGRDAFRETTNVFIKTKIPDTVETFGPFAFYYVNLDQTFNCLDHLPANLKTIGQSCFRNSTIHLNNADMPLGLTELPYEAFNAVKFVGDATTIKFNNVKTVGESAFWAISGNIVEADLSNVETINKNCFRNNSITSYVNTNKVKTIGEAAFYQSPQLTKDMLLPNCETIGNLAFSAGVLDWYQEHHYSCNKKEIPADNLVNAHHIYIPNVKVIGSNAFSYQKMFDLTDLEINTGNTVIKDGAFDKCRIKTLVMPDANTVPNVAKVPFTTGGQQYIDNLTLDGSYVNLNLVRLSSVDIDNEEYNNYVLDYRNFEYCNYVTTKNLKINNLDQLNSIIGLNYIGPITSEVNQLIEKCGVVPAQIFKNNPNITEYHVPDGTTEIMDLAFSKSSIETLYIPASVTRIRGQAFADCKNLKKIVFESGSQLREVGYGAFYGCENLSEIVGTTSIEDMHEFAFANCYKLVFDTEQMLKTSTLSRVTFRCLYNIKQLVGSRDLIFLEENNKFYCGTQENSTTRFYTSVEGLKSTVQVYADKKYLSASTNILRQEDYEKPIKLLDKEYTDIVVLYWDNGDFDTIYKNWLAEGNHRDLVKQVTIKVTSDEAHVLTTKNLQTLWKEGAKSIDLSEMKIENNAVGPSAFVDAQLDKLILPDNMVGIEQSAFKNAVIKDLQFDTSSVTSLKSYAFCNFKTDSETIFDFTKIVNFGEYTFCNAYMNINIDQIDAVSKCAFKGFFSKQPVTVNKLNPTITKIYENAFNSKCINVKKSDIDVLMNNNCGFEDYSLGKCNIVDDSNTPVTEFTIPVYTQAYRSFGTYALVGNQHIKKLKLQYGASVPALQDTLIEEVELLDESKDLSEERYLTLSGSCYNNTYLRSITTTTGQRIILNIGTFNPEYGVTKSVLAGCINFKQPIYYKAPKPYYSSSNTYIPTYLFEDTYMEEVNLVSDLPITINKDAFKNSYVKRINVVDKPITVIQEEALRGSTQLEYIDLSDDTVIYVGDNAFNGCNLLSQTCKVAASGNICDKAMNNTTIRFISDRAVTVPEIYVTDSGAIDYSNTHIEDLTYFKNNNPDTIIIKNKPNSDLNVTASALAEYCGGSLHNLKVHLSEPANKISYNYNTCDIFKEIHVDKFYNYTNLTVQGECRVYLNTTINQPEHFYFYDSNADVYVNNKLNDLSDLNKPSKIEATRLTKPYKICALPETKITKCEGLEVISTPTSKDVGTLKIQDSKNIHINSLEKCYNIIQFIDSENIIIDNMATDVRKTDISDSQFYNLKGFDFEAYAVANGDKIKIIRDNAFRCTKITGNFFSSLPNLTTLGSYLFYPKTDNYGRPIGNSYGTLDETTLDLSNVTSFGTGTFAYSNIKEVTLNDELKSLPTKTFYKTPIERVNIPASLESIGSYALPVNHLRCDINIPNTLRSSGSQAIYDDDQEEGYLSYNGYINYDPNNISYWPYIWVTTAKTHHPNTVFKQEFMLNNTFFGNFTNLESVEWENNANILNNDYTNLKATDSLKKLIFDKNLIISGRNHMCRGAHNLDTVVFDTSTYTIDNPYNTEVLQDCAIDFTDNTQEFYFGNKLFSNLKGTATYRNQNLVPTTQNGIIYLAAKSKNLESNSFETPKGRLFKEHQSDYYKYFTYKIYKDTTLLTLPLEELHEGEYRIELWYKGERVNVDKLIVVGKTESKNVSVLPTGLGDITSSKMFTCDMGKTITVTFETDPSLNANNYAFRFTANGERFTPSNYNYNHTTHLGSFTYTVTDDTDIRVEFDRITLPKGTPNYIYDKDTYFVFDKDGQRSFVTYNASMPNFTANQIIYNSYLYGDIPYKLSYTGSPSSWTKQVTTSDITKVQITEPFSYGYVQSNKSEQPDFDILNYYNYMPNSFVLEQNITLNKDLDSSISANPIKVKAETGDVDRAKNTIVKDVMDNPTVTLSTGTYKLRDIKGIEDLSTTVTYVGGSSSTKNTEGKKYLLAKVKVQYKIPAGNYHDTSKYDTSQILEILNNVDYNVITDNYIVDTIPIYIVFEDAEAYDLKVTTNISDGITFTPETKTDIAAGTVETISGQLTDGYSIQSITVNGEAYNISNIIYDTKNPTKYKFDVDINTFTNVHINVARPKVRLNIYTSKGGTVDALGEFIVEKGFKCSYNPLPNLGYKVKSILVNGEEIALQSSTYTKDILEDTTIYISFEKVQTPIRINVATSDGGTADKLGLFNILSGEDFEVNAIPDLDFRLSYILLNGTRVPSDGNVYTLQNVQEDTDIYLKFEKKAATCKVTASANTLGTVDKTGVVISTGDSVSITGTPLTGCELDHIEVNGKSINIEGNTYTLNNVEADMHVHFVFAKSRCKVEVSCSAGGTSNSTGINTVDKNSDFLIEAIPDAGYAINYIKVNGQIVDHINNQHLLENIITDKKVYIDFVEATERCKVKVKVIGDGTVTAQEGSNTLQTDKYYVVPVNTEVVLTCVPGKRQHLESVTANGMEIETDNQSINRTMRNSINSYTSYALTSTTHSTSYNVYKDTELLVVFGSNPIIYANVTSEDNGNGTTLISYNSTDHVVGEDFQAAEDDDIIVKATPNTGYEVQSIKINGIEQAIINPTTAQSINYTVTGNTHVEVLYKKINYEVTVNSNIADTLTVTSNSVIKTQGVSFQVPYQEQVNVTAINTASHTLKDIKVNGISLGNTDLSNNFTITEPTTINYIYDINKYPVTFTVIGDGTVTPAVTGNISYGDTLDYTLTPGTGYEVVSVKEDGVEVPLTSLLTYTTNPVQSAKNIEVTFKKIALTVTGIASTGGSITPTSKSVSYGDTVDVSITPDEGYDLTSLKINGIDVPLTTTFATSPITVNTTIEAGFTKQKRTLTVSAINGSTSITGSIDVDYGDSRVIMVTPNTGYELDKVIVNGAEVAKDTIYSTGQIKTNTTIQFICKIKEFNVTVASNVPTAIPQIGVNKVKYKESLPITINTPTGYDIKSIKINGVDNPITETFSVDQVTENKAVEILFNKKKFNVSVTSNILSAVNPAGNTMVEYGDTLPIKFTTPTGYELDIISIDGINAAHTGDFDLLDIVADKTVNILFKKKKFTVNVISHTGGSCDKDGTYTVEYLDEFILTPTAAVGYKYNYLTYNGVTVNNIGDAYQKQITEDATIEVYFKKNKSNHNKPTPESTVTPEPTTTLEPTVTLEPTPTPTPEFIPEPSPVPIQKRERVKITFKVGDKHWYINDVLQSYEMDQVPEVHGGRTYIPYRFLSYALKTKPEYVYWDPTVRSANIKDGDNIMTLYEGSNISVINYEKKAFDSSVYLTNGRVMLPINQILLVYKHRNPQVTWDSQGQEVNIYLDLIEDLNPIVQDTSWYMDYSVKLKEFGLDLNRYKLRNRK